MLTKKVHKASEALLKHIQERKKSSSNKNLLEAGNEDSPASAVPIWLVFSTKKHVVDKNRLKPGKISIPHSLNRPDSSICLITADPQRAFKDVLEEEPFPAQLRSQIRVLGLEKLKQRYKSFEQKRELMADYDIFLADDRIITNLPYLLGKTAYQSSKRPMPIDLKPSNEKNEPKIIGKRIKKDVTNRKTPSASTLAKRIESALASARVHLSPSASTSIHVGFSHFRPDQLEDNITAVVEGMIEKFVPKGWNNVKSIFIKGSETAALPIWQTTELWTEDTEVLEDKDAEAAKSIKSSNTKRKQGTYTRSPSKRTKLLGDESGFSPEMAARRAALRKAKNEATNASSTDQLKIDRVKDTQTKAVTNGKAKSKSVRSRIVSAAA